MDLTVTVYPEPGRFPQIARALLEVADHPRQVVSVSHPRAGFIVPEEVYDRFEEAMSPRTEDPADATPKRRPGRPRKSVQPDLNRERDNA